MKIQCTPVCKAQRTPGSVCHNIFCDQLHKTFRCTLNGCRLFLCTEPLVPIVKRGIGDLVFFTPGLLTQATLLPPADTLKHLLLSNVLHNRFVNKIIPTEHYEKDGLDGGLRYYYNRVNDFF